MPTVALEHDELVQAVQQAMAEQLRRDGRLRPGAELGLVFWANRDDDLNVRGTIRAGGRTLFELKGNRSHLAAVAAQLALSKLDPALKRSVESAAQVRWRAVRLTGFEENIDRFTADVEFSYRV